jgi:phenylalanyl-tRNA synthetase beta chain
MPAPVREPHRLAGVVIGELAPPSWLAAPPASDSAGFFALKGVLELLGTELGVGVSLDPRPEPFLHPGRAAAVEIGGEAAGWLGELHPLVARAWDLPGGVGFELDLAPLVAASGIGAEAYEDVTTHPAVLQDLAVTVPDEVSAERVRDAVRAGGGKLLERAEIFDLYHGSQLDPGTKSLALRLEFRAADRTLTDAEVAAQRERIKEALAEIGGSIRE